MSGFVAKTFREAKPVPMPTWPPAPPAPPKPEIVGRVKSAAVMEDSTISPVILELWSSGIVTWRDG